MTERYIADNPREAKENSAIEIHPGKLAKYADEINVECNSIVPMVSGPDHPDAVRSASEMTGVEIDQAFIGSATNGRIEDLEIAA